MYNWIIKQLIKQRHKMQQNKSNQILEMTRHEKIKKVKRILARDKDKNIQNFVLYEDQIKAEKCRQNFYYFVQQFIEELIPGDIVFGWHIEFLCDILQKYAFRIIARLPAESDLIINIPPGTTKCVCEGTPILTDRGFVPVEKIRRGYSVRSHSEGSLFKQKIVATERFEKSCVEIKTKMGSPLRVSSDHRVLTHLGWKEAEDLTKNDYLVSLCKEMDSNMEINGSELDFITLMLFEGSCSSGNRGFTSADKEVVDVMKKACFQLKFDIDNVKNVEKAYMQFRIKDRFTGGVRKLLQEYGMWGCLAIDKCMPPQFFNMSLKQKYRFVSLMIATDGFIIKRDGKVGIRLGSERLAKDIRLLLMTCGIPSNYYERKNGFAGEYSVIISGNDAKKLLGNIDCLQKQKDFENIFKKDRYSLSHGYPYEITKGLQYKAKQLRPRINVKKKGNTITNYQFSRFKNEIDPSLSKWEMDDFIYDRVTSVLPIGEKLVYHLQTESSDFDTQNFIANGLVVHNSTVISQLFPAWCWCAALPDENEYSEAYDRKRKKQELKPDKEGQPEKRIYGAFMRFAGISHAERGAHENANKHKDAVKSDKYKKYFPEIEIRRDASGVGNFKNHQRGQRWSVGIDGDIIGQHFDCKIIDDGMNPKASSSELKSSNANTYIDESLASRNTDAKVTVLIVVMQRLAAMDITGYLLAKEKKNPNIRPIQHICLPISFQEYIKPEICKDFYIANGGLLDPIRRDEQVIENERAAFGPYAASGQLDQVPIQRGQGLFNADNIVEDVPVPPLYLIEESVRYWDKAGTQGGGDYSCGVLMHRMKKNYDGPIYLVQHMHRGQWSSTKRNIEIRKTAVSDAKKFGMNVINWIEQEPGSGGKESAEITVKELAGFRVKTETKQSSGGKEARAEPYANQVEAFNVGFCTGSWNIPALAEMALAPRGAFDDTWDAGAGAFNKLAIGTLTAGTW